MYLDKVDALSGKKVMDVLMDLEVKYNGLGRRLIEEFFPGDLRDDEKAWWKGNRAWYDSTRSIRTQQETPAGSRRTNRRKGTIFISPADTLIASPSPMP